MKKPDLLGLSVRGSDPTSKLRATGTTRIPTAAKPIAFQKPKLTPHLPNLFQEYVELQSNEIMND